MKFTTDLPADYANSSAPFVLFCPPDPDAVSVDWRMKDGTWQRTEGPDQTRREGTITTIRGRNLGAYARLNQEEGKAYGWLPMPAFIEQLAAKPAEPVQAGTPERERELNHIKAVLRLASVRMYDTAAKLSQFAGEAEEELVG
jgi:hypothetical protein